MISDTIYGKFLRDDVRFARKERRERVRNCIRKEGRPLFPPFGKFYRGPVLLSSHVRTFDFPPPSPLLFYRLLRKVLFFRLNYCPLCPYGSSRSEKSQRRNRF